MKNRLIALTGSATLCALISASSAATLVSSDFSSIGLTSPQDIDVSGSSVVDWGYFNVDNMFLPGIVDNAKATSGIGTVTVTPGALATATFMWSDQLPKFTMTFDDGNTVASGTAGIGAGFGAWAPTEDQAAIFTFEELGAGTHGVRVFVGHSSNDRIFDMDYTVTASDGNLSGNTVSPAITSGDLHSTYEIVFSTTDPGASLTLQFNSTSGGTGSGWIGGYVVEALAASPVAPRLTSLGIVGGFESRQLELTLEGQPDTPYVFRSSATLNFDSGTVIGNLTQGDPDNDPGTLGDPDNSVIVTDNNGLAVLRVQSDNLAANFLRAEELIIGND